MSYKIGLILSMVFVVAFLLLGGDMLCLSAAYSSLDSNSISIGYLIAKSGRVDTEYLSYLEGSFNVTFLSITPSDANSGDVVEFTIYRMYDPLIISTGELRLTASRTTVIGYYG